MILNMQDFIYVQESLSELKKEELHLIMLACKKILKGIESEE